jgi:hypothetical protein
MNAAKRIRKFLEQNPGNPSSEILSRLVVSIGEESQIALDDLYALNYETFGYALDLLKEWRLDRYNVSKLRLFDTVLDSDRREAVQNGSAPAPTPHIAPPPRN